MLCSNYRSRFLLVAFIIHCVFVLVTQAIDTTHRNGRHRVTTDKKSQHYRGEERNVLEPSIPSEEQGMGGLESTAINLDDSQTMDDDKYEKKKYLENIEDKRQLQFQTAKEVMVKSQLKNDLLALETKTLCDEEFLNTFDLIESSDPWGLLAEDLYDEKVARNAYVEVLAETLQTKNVQVAYLTNVVNVLSRQRYRLYKTFTKNVLSQITIYQNQYSLQGSLYDSKSFQLKPDELKSLLQVSYTQEMNDLDNLYKQAKHVSCFKLYTHHALYTSLTL